jgi:hypothetical protein
MVIKIRQHRRRKTSVRVSTIETSASAAAPPEVMTRRPERPRTTANDETFHGNMRNKSISQRYRVALSVEFLINGLKTDQATLSTLHHSEPDDQKPQDKESQHRVGVLRDGSPEKMAAITISPDMERPKVEYKYLTTVHGNVDVTSRAVDGCFRVTWLPRGRLHRVGSRPTSCSSQGQAAEHRPKPLKHRHRRMIK